MRKIKAIRAWAVINENNKFFIGENECYLIYKDKEYAKSCCYPKDREKIIRVEIKEVRRRK